MEYFKQLFNLNRKENIGPNEIPRDIEDDILTSRRNQHPHVDTDISLSTHDHQNNTESEFNRMFREFENIFRGMFSEQPSIRYKFLEYHDKEKDENTSDEPKSLRERMLGGGDEGSDAIEEIITPFNEAPDRHENNILGFGPPNSIFGHFFNFPFGHNQYHPPQEDRDLDEDVTSGKQSLDDILQNDRTEHARDDTFFHPFLWDGLDPGDKKGGDFRGAFKYSTITKKYNPDGSVEIHSSKKDSSGNEETTVSRTLGDQTHTVINKTSKNGEQETKEDFVNMHENELKQFDDKWKSNQESPRSKLLVPNDENSKISNSDFFSSWWKPKL